MAGKVTDENDLGKALYDDRDTITVEGDLSRKVVKIKATGKVAWGVCIAAFGVAIAMVITTAATGGVAAPVTLPTAVVALIAPATAAMGLEAALSALAIGAAAAKIAKSADGGTAALKKLREYRVEKVSEDKIILHKK